MEMFTDTITSSFTSLPSAVHLNCVWMTRCVSLLIVANMTAVITYISKSLKTSICPFSSSCQWMIYSLFCVTINAGPEFRSVQVCMDVYMWNQWQNAVCSNQMTFYTQNEQFCKIYTCVENFNVISQICITKNRRNEETQRTIVEYCRINADNKISKV